LGVVSLIRESRGRMPGPNFRGAQAEVFKDQYLKLKTDLLSSGPRAQKTPRIRFLCMAQQKEIISTINSLIETLKDGQEGFKQAAEGVKDSTLKSLFNEYSLQRAKFAGELQAQAVQLGESDPEDSSSTSGAMHRAWINIKSAITSEDDHAILAECERGEDSAVSEYKEALEEDISAPIRDIISRQYSEVQSAHDRIKSLRDAAKTS
jgi:uncharacterized protein (TIGR02284 family)